MKDRQPLKPGRIKITLDNGTVLMGVMERADEPVEPGHPINKNTLLKDATAKMLGGNPETMLPDDAIQMLAALAASGGSGSGDVADLEDTALEVGSFTNAAAGWNTYRFREAFDAPPQVVLSAEAFEGMMQLQNITAESFQYCLRVLSSASYYTATGTASTSANTANTLVNGTTTTAAAIKINYLAVEYGGER